MALIECERLCIGYGAKIVAKDISLKIEKNDYLYIIGENGSGKSTLMKTLLGLLPPVSGEIKFDGGLKKMKQDIFRSKKNIRGIFLHQCGKSFFPDARMIWVGFRSTRKSTKNLRSKTLTCSESPS